MPIYQYRCVNGHEFEVMQRMSDDALDTCEVCGATASRVLFAPAIHFKGSGFHNTDYGTRRRPVSEDGGGSSGGSGGGEGGSSNGAGAKESGGAKSSDSGGTGGGKTVGLDKV
ncbi:MAG TPA: zinc ribbon domain-containing protein [Miltoncostaeaceae bacterium]|nr:zinc ribbon domain-containing protein [Miltoncostaeaceae bacterium]